jgi:hypothetical protein
MRLLKGTEQDQKEAHESLPTVISGLRNFKLFTNCPNCPFFDFPMAGDTGDLTLRGVQPNGMPATFAIKETTMSAQVPLQVEPFHASGSSMISRTASDERFFSARSRWHSKTSLSASRRFTLASASVSPCEIAAGISSTKQVYPPSLAGSKTAVNFMRINYHIPGSLQTCLLRVCPARVCRQAGLRFRVSGAEAQRTLRKRY